MDFCEWDFNKEAVLEFDSKCTIMCFETCSGNFGVGSNTECRYILAAKAYKIHCFYNWE